MFCEMHAFTLDLIEAKDSFPSDNDAPDSLPK